MYSSDAITWTSTTSNADFSLTYLDGPTSYLIRDQSAVHYLWRDEVSTIHTSGDTNLPQWNLGYLESTDSPPFTFEDPFYKIFLQKAPVRLDITDGDKIHFTPFWSIDPTKTIDAMMQVSEHFDTGKSPAWYQEIKSIVIFNSVEGGALPGTIERVAAYTPLVSSGFDGNLDPTVNNLQALAQAVDDLIIGSAPVTTAVNDFQVGNGLGAWVKKTLAETITILRTSLDGVYSLLGHSHTAPDAADVTYTPLDVTDWTSDVDPGDVDNALDQLADRLNTVETTPAGYSTIEDEGTARAQQTTMNFTGAGVSAVDLGGKTVINIPGGSGAEDTSNNNIPVADLVISANYSLYISGEFEITAGLEHEIGINAELEIG
jgi:hypothetical protein